MKFAETLAVAALCLASAQTACIDDGWVDFGDDNTTSVCMYFVQSKATWRNMRTLCQEAGGDLAKVADDVYMDVLSYIYDETDFNDECYWIGGMKADTEDSWKWLIDGTDIPLGTPYWYPCDDSAEPNGGYERNLLGLCSPGYYYSFGNSWQMFGICQL